MSPPWLLYKSSTVLHYVRDPLNMFWKLSLPLVHTRVQNISVSSVPSSPPGYLHHLMVLLLLVVLQSVQGLCCSPLVWIPCSVLVQIQALFWSRALWLPWSKGHGHHSGSTEYSGAHTNVAITGRATHFSVGFSSLLAESFTSFFSSLGAVSAAMWKGSTFSFSFLCQTILFNTLQPFAFMTESVCLHPVDNHNPE